MHLIATAGFDTCVCQHKCLFLVIKGKYYPCYVVGFENKQNSKRKRTDKKD